LTFSTLTSSTEHSYCGDSDEEAENVEEALSAAPSIIQSSKQNPSEIKKVESIELRLEKLKKRLATHQVKI